VGIRKDVLQSLEVTETNGLKIAFIWAKWSNYFVSQVLGGQVFWYPDGEASSMDFRPGVSARVPGDEVELALEPLSTHITGIAYNYPFLFSVLLIPCCIGVCMQKRRAGHPNLSSSPHRCTVTVLRTRFWYLIKSHHANCIYALSWHNHCSCLQKHQCQHNKLTLIPFQVGQRKFKT
jgi:hypothetical protein